MQLWCLYKWARFFNVQCLLQRFSLSFEVQITVEKDYDLLDAMRNANITALQPMEVAVTSGGFRRNLVDVAKFLSVVRSVTLWKLQ